MKYKYEKIICLNDTSDEVIKRVIIELVNCMLNTNKFNNYEKQNFEITSQSPQGFELLRLRIRWGKKDDGMD
jgi:hypothetical protein